MPTVSVVMGTCNGARHLDEQLASIAAQTRLPLELVASDDASDDETVSILRSFATHAPFEVRIVENSTRLGFGANFLRAARLARGELIAWSDQDDVWMPQKLARCAAEFDKDPDVRLVVHSRRIGERTTRTGRPLIRGGAIVRASRLGRRRRVFTPESLPVQFAAPGFASVLDARVLATADSLQVTLPGGFGDYGHDTWTAFVGAALGKVVYLPEELAYYRQHERNLFGAPTGGGHGRKGRDPLARAASELARGNGRAELLNGSPDRDRPRARSCGAATRRPAHDVSSSTEATAHGPPARGCCSTPFAAAAASVLARSSATHTASRARPPGGPAGAKAELRPASSRDGGRHPWPARSAPGMLGPRSCRGRTCERALGRSRPRPTLNGERGRRSDGC